jgi:hypothetical protein
MTGRRNPRQVRDGTRSIIAKSDQKARMSLAQRILTSGKPFTIFHTWTVSEDLLRRAIQEERSMDLDVCIDDSGNPYLGHSREYHEKSGEPYFHSLPLWEVVDRISKSNIVTMIDCKHYDAWPVIEAVVAKIGPERCMVDSYVSEFKFGHSRADGEPDFLTEWTPIERLRELKAKFPPVTTAACAKWPPQDLLLSAKYRKLAAYIRDLTKENRIDGVCLSVPDETITDEWLRYFLAEDIIPRIEIDRTDTNRLTQVYVGQTDDLGRTSRTFFRP